MVTWGFVGLGASLGAITRYELTKTIKKRVFSYFPWGTLVINLIACFLLGIFAAVTLKIGHFYAFAGLGFCGGLSTFSTFSFESLLLIQEHHWAQFWRYLLFSVIGGLLMIGLGFFLFRH